MRNVLFGAAVVAAIAGCRADSGGALGAEKTPASEPSIAAAQIVPSADDINAQNQANQNGAGANVTSANTPPGASLPDAGSPSADAGTPPPGMLPAMPLIGPIIDQAPSR